MSKTIDLNADLGEDESEEAIVRDLAMMEIVSSCNIACGGHAGSPANMERMLVAGNEACPSSIVSCRTMAMGATVIPWDWDWQSRCSWFGARLDWTVW